MTRSRVKAPTPPRAWWIGVGAVAGVAWLVTITANVVAWHDTGDGILSQFNAFGFSLAGSLTILAGLLFVLRRLLGAVHAGTAVSDRLNAVCERLLAAVETNDRATAEVCQSYADTLRDLHVLRPQTLRRTISARNGHPN